MSGPDPFAEQRLDGKVVVVTGSTQGLGREIAERAALSAYAASKAALAVLTKSAGYLLQPDRIRVNGLNVGWTATEGEHVAPAEA